MVTDNTNNKCLVAVLPDRGIVGVDGPDARDFLQGIVSNDITGVTKDKAIFAGLLTPQGKILFDFFVIEVEGRLLLDCHLPLVDALIKRLMMYKLRAEVEIKNLSEQYEVIVCWGGKDTPKAGFSDPRLAEMGQRIILPTYDVKLPQCDYASSDHWHQHRIIQGVPHGGIDYEYGNTFPHDVWFDKLAGVDFQKGCYVGQEVVSRMQHKSSPRKRTMLIRGKQALPDSGTNITAGDSTIGTLGSVSGSHALALVRLDRLAKAVSLDQQPQAGDVDLTIIEPVWAIV